MMFPLDLMGAANREVGLVVAMLIGIGFGFVLERAGFGTARVLTGQFYLHDMTVFKVMFSAVVTAMLGLVVLGGVGVVNLPSVLQTAASGTFIWPMLVGGLVLGVGFIVSGYCPGTSLVASASGKIDGMMTFLGVIVGSVLYGELYPLLGSFTQSGAMGQKFLDQVTGIPRPLLALGVAVMAIGMFFGAEKVERIFQRRRSLAVDGDPAPKTAIWGRFALAGMGAVAILGVATLALPESTRAAGGKQGPTIAKGKTYSLITVSQLAGRMVKHPWSLRIVDVRPLKLCKAKTLPGAECMPKAKLKELNLDVGPGSRDLVLLCRGDIEKFPRVALTYKGRVLVLKGGYAAWEAYALKTPKAPGDNASPAAWSAYRFQSAFHQSVTGRKTAPAVKASKYVPKRKKKKRGGCS